MKLLNDIWQCVCGCKKSIKNIQTQINNLNLDLNVDCQSNSSFHQVTIDTNGKQKTIPRGFIYAGVIEDQPLTTSYQILRIQSIKQLNNLFIIDNDALNLKYIGTCTIDVRIDFAVNGYSNSTQRSIAFTQCYHNNQEILDSFLATYHRIVNDGTSGGSNFTFLTLQEGDTIDIRTRKEDTNDAVTISGKDITNLSIQII